MNRRAFLSGVVQTVAAAAVAARLVREEGTTPAVVFTPHGFRPEDYQGDFRWMKVEYTISSCGASKFTNEIVIDPACLDQEVRKLLIPKRA